MLISSSRIWAYGLMADPKAKLLWKFEPNRSTDGRDTSKKRFFSRIGLSKDHGPNVCFDPPGARESHKKELGRYFKPFPKTSVPLNHQKCRWTGPFEAYWRPGIKLNRKIVTGSESVRIFDSPVQSTAKSGRLRLTLRPPAGCHFYGCATLQLQKWVPTQQLHQVSS